MGDLNIVIKELINYLDVTGLKVFFLGIFLAITTWYTYT